MTILKILLLYTVFWSMTAKADDANYPELNDTDELSLMGALSDHDWHDLQDERWNAYVQGTYISQWQPAFPAAYSKLNGTPILCYLNQITALRQPYALSEP